VRTRGDPRQWPPPQEFRGNRLPGAVPVARVAGGVRSPVTCGVMDGEDAGHAVEFEIDGVRFVRSFVDSGGDGRFTLMKPASLVAQYERLLRELEQPLMVELGIAYGGSLAYFALRARPRRLIGIEYEPRRLGHLDRFIESRGLTDVVKPYHGVDQADRDRLREIVTTEFGEDPIDLVIDDASHVYDPTLASFETLFPFVRPGGLYVIEDWAGQHKMADALGRRLAQATPEESLRLAAIIAERIESGPGAVTPLARLAIEFMLVQASDAPPIEEVTVNRHWIAARRGRAPVPTKGFRLADHYDDTFDLVRA
jgi:cephalosporin hydroxylase